jgi:hypothetical protein
MGNILTKLKRILPVLYCSCNLRNAIICASILIVQSRVYGLIVWAASSMVPRKTFLCLGCSKPYSMRNPIPPPEYKPPPVYKPTTCTNAHLIPNIYLIPCVLAAFLLATRRCVQSRTHLLTYV